jgi:hypothetical protein
MRLHLCAICIAALTVAGCANRIPPPTSIVQRYYQSQPTGAQVVRDGVVLGRTPFRYPERISLSTVAGRTVATCSSQQPVTFKWDSGATTQVEYPCHESAVAMAVRPAEAPGLDQDLKREKRVLAYKNRSSGPNDWLHWQGRGPGRGIVSGVGMGITEAPRFY